MVLQVKSKEGLIPRSFKLRCEQIRGRVSIESINNTVI